MEPTTLQDENGRLVMSGIHTYGDTVHLFIERGDYNGVFMPGFRKWESNYNPPETGCSTSTIASATSDGTR
jgi:4-hydroxyphenylpyruvate dioxygenase